MGKESLLAAISRAPWRAVGRQALARAGFELVLGRSESIALIQRIPNDDPRLAVLSYIVEELLAVSEKSVVLYRVGGSAKKKIRDWIDGKRRASNPLTTFYPGVAPERVRRSASIGELSSLGKQELAAGVNALYTGVHEYLQREEIPLSDVRDHQDFERVYGQRRIFWQTFSCLWLPGLRIGQDEVLVSMTDQPEKAPKDFADRAHRLMASELRRGAGLSAQPINLFDAIQNLYSNNEGNLLLHGFINNAEAVKYHRGRRDLRKDAYDIAGARAVGSALQPFRVGVSWKLVDSEGAPKSSPTLQILGTSRILAKPMPTINDAVVGNCIDSEDMKFVIERLLANL